MSVNHGEHETDGLDWITSGRFVTNLSCMELEVVEEGRLIGEMVCIPPSSAVEPPQPRRRERSSLARPCRATTSTGAVLRAL